MRYIIRLIGLILFAELYSIPCNSQKVACSHVAPMLDMDVMVVNGGIIRLFPWQTFESENRKEYVSIFKECPYQKTAPIIYNRLGWWSLEPEKDNYAFTEVIEPMLKQAVAQHSRVILGLASMCGEKTMMSHLYRGKWMATPDYLYEELLNSEWPMHEDNQFCRGDKGLSISYDSPLVYERFSKLLHAFSKWLDKKLTGTNLRRKDVIYAIEMRHLGYWGEGGVRWEDRPKTDLLSKYIDLYIKEFPHILLIGGINSTVHLPLYKGNDLNKYSAEDLSMMRYNYKLMTARNKVGRIGGFIDSWMPNNNQFDSITKRVMIDKSGNIVFLRDFLQNNYWGKVYLTGEFGYLINDSNKDFYPYEEIVSQFYERRVSGISTHNVSAFYGFDSTGKPYNLGKKEYMNVKKALSVVGYRIVLNSVEIEKKGRKYEVIIKMKNIGTSSIFHDYYEAHILTRDSLGNIVSDIKAPFCFKSFRGIKDQTAVNGAEEVKIICRIPNKKGKIFLLIKDKYNIEFPMTLSNFGRMPNGSYLLGIIN